MSVSTKINDGGPAFPRPYSDDSAMRSNGCGGCNHVPEQEGMSLRDWFAGKALPILIALEGKNNAPAPMPSMEYIAARAYAFADAMIAARSKP